METRPRRSHHRPLQGKLDTRSLPSPKQFPPTIAAALQSGPGRVWTPVLVRDQPWLYDSASRSHLSSSCWGSLRVSLFLGFLLFPGWRFPVSLRRVCVCVLVWVHGCVFVVFRAWAFVVPSAFLRCLCSPFGAAPWVCVGWRLARVGFPVPFPGFFSPGSRKTHGGRGRSDESATRPHQLRKSSKLRAQQISCAKVESHSLSTLSVYQMARSELRL